MRRTSAQRFLLLIALFHLFSDAAYAGGAVLCVGSDDHRQVESEHVADLGCQTATQQQPGEVGPGTSESSPESCVDSPLHSDAEIVSQIDDGSDLGIAGTIVHPSEGVRKNTAPLASLARAPDVLPSLRAHRTTVLVI